MSEYFIYYTESSIVCLIIFAIMLLHDVFSVDRQEKQIKYDHALIAFMLYFVSDAFWAAVIAEVIPKTTFSVITTNFFNAVFMAYITYAWLQYVLAVEQTPHRNRSINRLLIALPLIASTALMVVIYLLWPDVLIDSSSHPTIYYSIFQIAVPIFYIFASLFYTLRKAHAEKNPDEKLKHFYVGFFPLLVVGGGLLQVLVLPNTPVFCFSCAILMLIFNMQAKDSQISLDPLTGLNNRSQLNRYVSLDPNMHREGRRTFVIMIDINDFKQINDTYGHAEGDNALLIMAQALRNAASEAGMPLFIARYGGDEFVLIVHPQTMKDADALIQNVRSHLEAGCKAAGTPYILKISAGCAEFSKENDTFQNCLERADKLLYEDKQRTKDPERFYRSM